MDIKEYVQYDHKKEDGAIEIHVGWDPTISGSSNKTLFLYSSIKEMDKDEREPLKFLAKHQIDGPIEDIQKEWQSFMDNIQLLINSFFIKCDKRSIYSSVAHPSYIMGELLESLEVNLKSSEYNEKDCDEIKCKLTEHKRKINDILKLLIERD